MKSYKSQTSDFFDKGICAECEDQNCAQCIYVKSANTQARRNSKKAQRRDYKRNESRYDDYR